MTTQRPYERTVQAALDETASKFRLAEALYLDIPRPDPERLDYEASTTERLAEARQRIIDAGGEPRAVKTLEAYRLTAAWVSDCSSSQFRWVPGMSFSAHIAANAGGVAYADFAARPRNSLETRNEAGYSIYRPETVIPTWTPEQRAEAVRELTADDAGADAALEALRERARAEQEAARQAAEAAPDEPEDCGAPTVTLTMRRAAVTYAYEAKALMAELDAEQYNVPPAPGEDPWVNPAEWAAIVRFRQAVGKFHAVMEQEHQRAMTEQAREDAAAAEAHDA